MKSFRFHRAVRESRSGEHSLLYKIHTTIFIWPRGMRHITVQRAEFDREKMTKGPWKSTGLLVHWKYFFFSIWKGWESNCGWILERGTRWKSGMGAALKLAGEAQDWTGWSSHVSQKMEGSALSRRLKDQFQRKKYFSPPVPPPLFSPFICQFKK